MSQERIKLVIVDDHRIMREGLRLLIDRQPDMQVVGEAGDAAGALQCALRCSPDLVVMDLHLPDESGVEAARKIFRERPATTVVMLSSQLDPFYVQAALRAGELAIAAI